MKAIYVHGHGPCEAEVSIQQDIVNALRLELRNQLLGTQCGGVVKNIFIDGISITSYVRDELPSYPFGTNQPMTPGRPIGGFLVGGHVLLDIKGIFINTGGKCAIDFLYDYQFDLNDGFLSVSISRHHLSLNGDEIFIAPYTFWDPLLYPTPWFVPAVGLPTCSAIGSVFQRIFEKIIPETIASKALDKVSLVLADLPEPLGGLFRMAGLADPENTLQFDCSNASGTLKGLAKQGAAKFFNKNTIDGTPLAAAIDATVAKGANTPWGPGFGNWGVRYTPDMRAPPPPTCFGRPAVAKCAWTLRATGLTVNPDTVNLTWFGDSALSSMSAAASEMNSSLLFFFVLLDGQNGPFMSPFIPCGDRAGLPRCDGYRNLCTRAYQTVNDLGPGQYVRYFASGHQGIASCADAPFPFPDWCCTADISPWTCDMTAHRLTGGTGCTSDAGCFGSEHCIKGACFPIGRPCDKDDPFGPDCPHGSICTDGPLGPECRR